MENTINKGGTCETCSLRNKLIIAGLALAAVLKLVLYYSLMGAESGFAAAVVITFAVTVFLFGAVKIKWIAAAVYLMLSILMAVDVNYYNFFNRSLSVKALGAAGLLGGVTESIKELFMPVTLLIPVDALIILVLCIVFREKLRNESERAVRIAAREIKVWIISLVLLAVSLAALVLIVPEEESAGKSVLSQEFFSYHLRDITGINPMDEDETDMKDILAVEGNYENEKDGEDFGCGEGMNLIVVQVEAMQDFVIGRTYNGQEITPFINSLLEEDTFYFDSYYQQTGNGNTSDAEFATNNSLYGSMQSYTYKLFKDNYWRGLPVLLKEKGYSTSAFHAFEPDFWSRDEAYPGQGFDRFYSQDDFHVTEELGMGLSDRLFFKQSMDIIGENKEPFYAFMVTLSSHYPFDIAGRLELEKEDKDTVFGDYLQSMNYMDKCFEELFTYLEEEGLADNTIVALYGDHLGLNPNTDEIQERMSEFLGWDYGFEDAMNVPLIINVPGSGVSKTIDVVGGQTDFLPTIAYLMGFDTLDTIYLGHNLCTVKSNFVPIRSYMPQGSFVMGDIMFKMSRSGLLSDAEAVNIRTHEKLPSSEYEGYYAQALQLQRTSDHYLDNDIIGKVYLEGGSLTELVTGAEQSGFYSPIEQCDTIMCASAGEGKTDGLYCLENFDRLYDEGVRAFALNLIWTNDGHTMVMNSWDELENYFTKWERINSYKAVKNAFKYNSIEGITAMTGEDLISWIQEHEDAVFFISIDDDEILEGVPYTEDHLYFAKTVRDTYPELMDRVVFLEDNVMDLEKYNYEDIYNVMFSAEDDYSVDNILSVDSRYDMYGIAVDMSIAESEAKTWKKAEHNIYVYTDSADVEQMKEELGISGVVIVHDSVL